ncbi:MAG: hypothetical protein QXI93_05070 [Candidatus Methanomethylicia archaeon]
MSLLGLLLYLVSICNNRAILCRFCKNLEVVDDEESTYFYCKFFDDFVEPTKVKCEGFEELPLKI